MPTNLSRCRAVYLFSAVLISWSGSTVAAQAQREPGQPEAARESAPATSETAVRREPWHLVRIPDPLARRATIAALESASAQLADADCRRSSPTSTTATVDPSPTDCRPWRSTFTPISPWSRSSTTRATRDAPAESWCSPLLAAAWCVSALNELKRINAQQPDYVVATLIHEILHTLGLGENPPSSREITARVLARCGRK